VALLAVAAAVLAPASQADWEVVSSANVGASTNGLADVVALSESDAWAVGVSFDVNKQVNKTLIEHWDGRRWRVSAHPNVGSGYRSFVAVDASGPSDVWAVGSYSKTRFASEQSLLMRWNGASWTSFAAPALEGWDGIYDVSVVSSTDAWAIGNSYTGSFVLRWNGSSWSSVPHPNVGYLTAIDAVSANDVWIVGQKLVDGFEALYGVLTLHWNGASWTEVQSPSSNEHFTLLYSVHGVASNDVWAVGAAWDSTKPFHTYIQHWDGASWSIVPGATVGANAELFGVRIVSPTEVWAVGRSDGMTLTERWNGAAWEVVDSPSPGTTNALVELSSLPSGRLWAVGNAAQGTTPRTLTLRSQP
jgi:hypothetical protein